MITKLTHTDYKLHIIEALGSNGLMDGGTTQPLAIRGVNKETGDRSLNYVLKWRNSQRLSISNMTNELLGAWMAIELEIDCVEPVLINLSESFVQNVMKDQEGYKLAQQSLGINFGSIYKEGLFPFVNQISSLNHDQVNQAIMIFIFDMFIDNADRGQGRTNLFYLNERIIVLDHEMAFSFTELIFAHSKAPWIIENDKDLFTKHPLLPFLRNSNPKIEENIQKLSLINGHFWECVHNWLPDECKTDRLSIIKSRLDSVIDKKDIFAEQIYKILQS